MARLLRPLKDEMDSSEQPFWTLKYDIITSMHIQLRRTSTLSRPRPFGSPPWSIYVMYRDCVNGKRTITMRPASQYSHTGAPSELKHQLVISGLVRTRSSIFLISLFVCSARLSVRMVCGRILAR
jgi:hypothetical protein